MEIYKLTSKLVAPSYTPNDFVQEYWFSHKPSAIKF